MSNAIVYKDGSEHIILFLKEAILSPGLIVGVGGRIRSKNLINGSLKILWTDQEATPIIDNDPESSTYEQVIGYEETVSDFTPLAVDGPTISAPERSVYLEAIKKRHELAQFDFTQLETYIENNVTDLASAKDFLQKLSKVVLGIIKISDYQQG